MLSKQPLEYVIGYKDFLGIRIDLAKKPLIPRPETEFWVKQAIKEIKKNKKAGQNLEILDIFSGSGCIGLALLAYIKNSKVVFADNDKKAIEQIKLNTKNVVGTIIQSDVFSKIVGKYDYIFANPPYIPTRNKHLVQESVLWYEPNNALFAGEDGLQYITLFLQQAKNFLKKSGSIFMEFDPPQKKQIEILLKKYRYHSWKFKKDQYKKWRYVIIQ